MCRRAIRKKTGFTKEKIRVLEMHSFENYIFYMSDFSTVSGDSRYGKMNADHEIIRQIEKNLHNCKTMKYTDYNGEYIQAKSVGIVFPSHTWGISLAVYSFLQNLNVSSDTYVYAVTMGSCMSGDVDFTMDYRTKNLKEFERIFTKRNLGDCSDIFVRCVDYKRSFETVEDKLRQTDTIQERVENILEGLLFYDLDAVESKRIFSVKEADRAYWKKLAAGTDDSKDKKEKKDNRAQKTEFQTSGTKMGNVFLDENFLSGVRLCRVI